MSQIKFNEPAVLKGLLDKTKTSTIRKAYEITNRDIAEKAKRDKNLTNGQRKFIMNIDNGIIDKPCKYEVGKIYEAVWTLPTKTTILNAPINEEGNLVLGKVKIISVEKIKISFDNIDTLCMKYWQSEGFGSADGMKEFLLKYAPEIKKRAMPFWLIKWVWV